MVAFRLPAGLVTAVPAAESPERSTWLAGLAGQVRELAQRWSLELAEPFQPGGSCSWVAPARDRLGRDLVLKVGWRHDEARDEAAGLQAWAGQGAVLVHAAHVAGSTSALLLERCRPGVSLAASRAEPQQDVVVAAVLRQLWSTSPGGYPFRPLQVMCRTWAAEFWERLAARPGVLDPGLARVAMDLLVDLPTTADRHVLLATDLHAGNVLAAHRQPWLAIDLKPYLGDPTYDVLQHLLNCQQRLLVDPVGLVRRVADLLELDASRLLLWLFARSVRSRSTSRNCTASRPHWHRTSSTQRQPQVLTAGVSLVVRGWFTDISFIIGRMGRGCFGPGDTSRFVHVVASGLGGQARCGAARLVESVRGVALMLGGR